MLLPTGCARTSADKTGTSTPDNTDPGLRPQGDPVDQVGWDDDLRPTDGAAPVKPGTGDRGNPGVRRVELSA